MLEGALKANRPWKVAGHGNWRAAMGTGAFGRAVALRCASNGRLDARFTARELRRNRIFGYESPCRWAFEMFLGHVHPNGREVSAVPGAGGGGALGF
jgi:hypothetical protein